MSGLVLLVLPKRSPTIVLVGPDCSPGLSSGWPAEALALAGLHRLIYALPGWESQGEINLSLLGPDLAGRDLDWLLSELAQTWWSPGPDFTGLVHTQAGLAMIDPGLGWRSTDCDPGHVWSGLAHFSWAWLDSGPGRT